MKNITISGAVSEHGAISRSSGFNRYSYVLIEPDDGRESIRVTDLSARDELSHYLTPGSTGTFLIAKHNGVNTLFAVRNAQNDVIDPRLPKILTATHPLIYLMIVIGVLFVPFSPIFGMLLAAVGIVLFVANRRRKSSLSQAVAAAGFSLRTARRF